MKKHLLIAFALFFYSNFAVKQSAKIDTEELKAVKEIWGKLGLAARKEWDFNKDPCSSEGKWLGSVGCDCSFESNTVCHVRSIQVPSLNISTALPLEFIKFPHLQTLILSRNYFSGTVPSEWATLRPVTISLLGNRLSGPFPIALTGMTTLQDLSIEANSFSGPIPEEIANLKLLDRLALSSNHFTGELPTALAKLTSLTQLRINDNNFTGKIPNFISQMTQIERLHIQGCSFEGPFPSTISELTQLFDLRISDLKGGAISPFPQLQNMLRLDKLVLRNCFIHGTIPDYVGRLIRLKTLDLSFNNLTGEIPSSFSELTRTADYIYLTANNLSGTLPEWVLSSTKFV